MLKLDLQISRANLTPRAHAKIMREIHRRAMERQWTERVPKHFDMVAYSEYGARKRSSKYNEWKLKRRYIGHTRPNVATGNLKRRLKAKITATQYGAKLSMSSSLDKKIDPEEWAKMSKAEQAKVIRKQRRLAAWQKREIEVMSRKEIQGELKQQAKEYKRAAESPEYRRKRQRRIK